jgi:hypothetical protein
MTGTLPESPFQCSDIKEKIFGDDSPGRTLEKGDVFYSNRGIWMRITIFKTTHLYLPRGAFLYDIVAATDIGVGCCKLTTLGKKLDSTVLLLVPNVS